MLEMFVNILLNGVYYAGILFLMSAGLQIIFGVLRIVNFAHAAAYILGIYFTFAIVKPLPPDFSFLVWIAPLIAAGLVGLLGLAFERGLLRLIYHRDHVFQILVTAGVVYIVDDLIRLKWGGYSIGVGPFTSATVNIAGVVYPVYNLLIILITIVVAVLLQILFRKTDVGRVIRATAHDEEMTKAMGVNVDMVKALTFLFGSAIAGLAGGLMLPVTGGWPGVGNEYLILGFVVIALAGLGSINGALIAAVIVGMVNSIGIQFFPEIELAIIFIIMAVILTVKPSGLFGAVPHR
jgi:branched-chain amino acid transport system permease protein